MVLGLPLNPIPFNRKAHRAPRAGLLSVELSVEPFTHALEPPSGKVLTGSFRGSGFPLEP